MRFHLLTRVDLVKFSDHLPSPIKKRADVREAIEYIQATAPVAADAGPNPVSEVSLR